MYARRLNISTSVCPLIMSLKKNVKKIQRAMARQGMYFFYGLFAYLPYSVIRVIAKVLLFIGFQLIIRQKRIAKESLKIAFKGHKTPEELRDITRRCFQNFGQGIVEMLYYLSHPEKVADVITFEGKHHLDEAIAKGNGVIAVTAHFGNFPLMMLHCAQQGYKTNSIIRPTRDEQLEKFLFQKRTEVGLNTVYAIPRRECVTQSLKVLRNNEMLFIPIDQNFGSEGGVFVEFFGHKAATATGPVIFAERTKAPIIPMFIIREGKTRHRIIVEPPYEMKEFPDEEKTIQYNMEKITNLIERYIREYPHEWAWMHRRWKSKPEDPQPIPNAQ